MAAAALATAVRALEPAPLVVLAHLAGLPAGPLACHQALAADAGLAARIREDLPNDHPDGQAVERAPGWMPSIWTLVGEESDVAARLSDNLAWRGLQTREGVRAWTDDYANPLALRR